MDVKHQTFRVDDDFNLLETVREQEGFTRQAPPEAEWFHGKMNREEAARLLSDHPIGAYLLRESIRNVGDYSISFKAPRGVKHFKVLSDDYGGYFIADMSFNSLGEVVEFFCNEYLTEDTRLEFPVRPSQMKPSTSVNRLAVVTEDCNAMSPDEISVRKGDEVTILNDSDAYWVWVTLRGTHLAGFVPKSHVQDLGTGISEREAAAACRLPPAFRRERWLHGRISRHDAVARLEEEGIVGSFLVRASSSGKDLTLSFLSPKGVQHFRISVLASGHYELGGRTFDCLEAIILRYTNDPLSEETKLTRAVSANRVIVDEDDDDYSDVQAMLAQKKQAGQKAPAKPQPLRKQGHATAMEGHLTKKARKSKKWKSMFFRLVPDRRRLFYFDSEVSAKPRGIIDLAATSLHPLDDSFFGRPNCFMMIVNSTEVFLCADTEMDLQQWMMALAPVCSSTTTGPTLEDESAAYHITGLDFDIIEAKDIPAKANQAYCIASLNTIKFARTPAKPSKDSSVFWAEKYSISNLSDAIHELRVTLLASSKRKDQEYGSLAIPLSSLPPGKETVGWHELKSPDGAKVGSVRLGLRLVQDTVLPVQDYRPLKALILDVDLQAIHAIEACAKAQLTEVAKYLVRIWRALGNDEELLRRVLAAAVQETPTENTLFRANTIATKAVDEYMKMIGMPFLKVAIEDVVRDIFDEKRSFELDPTRPSGAKSAENFNVLADYVNRMCSKIFESAEACPSELRYIMSSLQQEAVRRFPGNDSIRYTCVSAFIFLRLIVPAVLNPKLFNMMPDHPSEQVARNLTLVAKVLQNLANFVEFGGKEPYMAPCNALIAQLQEKMRYFISKLATHKGTASPVKISGAARDFAALVRFLTEREKDLDAAVKDAKGSAKTLPAVVHEVNRKIAAIP